MKHIPANVRHLRRAALAFMLALTLLGALLPGAALAAPPTAATQSAAPKPVEWNGGGNCSAYYTVRYGDNLSSIAFRFGTSMQAIMQANGIWNPNRLLAGTVLCIPGGYQPRPPHPQPNPPSGDCDVCHFVRRGDTLSSIAAYYGVSPWAIAQANGIWNWNLIFVGQKLCIPSGYYQPQPLPQPLPQPIPPQPYPPQPYPPQPQPLPPCPPQPCPPQPCPGPNPQPCPPVYGFWNGEYFANRDLAGSPTFVRQDNAIAFDWDSVGPGGGIPATNFSVRWTRNEYFSGGNYRFWTTVDDGVRVWVDGVLVLDFWRVGPATSVSCDHYLSPGNHDIRVEYFQAEGVALMYFKYARL